MRHRTATQLHASYYMSGSTYKIGRDAKTGQFITVKQAKRRKSTAVVETMKKKK